ALKKRLGMKDEGVLDLNFDQY
ncbi:MAG: hypothetical protein H6Q37_2541, partial [Chloroflexi bacterium]|nr:hypothetical protein [Chloroflexota bacterium]